MLQHYCTNTVVALGRIMDDLTILVICCVGLELHLQPHQRDRHFFNPIQHSHCASKTRPLSLHHTRSNYLQYYSPPGQRRSIFLIDFAPLHVSSAASTWPTATSRAPGQSRERALRRGRKWASYYCCLFLRREEALLHPPLLCYSVCRATAAGAYHLLHSSAINCHHLTTPPLHFILSDGTVERVQDATLGL